MQVQLKAALVAVVAVLALAEAAPAQDVGAARDDLVQNDVTFEEGALTDRDLAELDRTTAGLQRTGAGFKVVVLADEVDDFASADAFAAAVLNRLGGHARVLVFTPSAVGLASDVDAGGEVASAKARAIDAANASDSYGQGVTAAAQALGVTSGSGGGGGGLLLLLVLLAGAVVLFLVWRASRQRGEQQLSASAIQSAEGRVRGEVDVAANLVLELSERADAADAPDAAKEHFRAGAKLFAESQELLEEADTQPELTDAYARVVEARWRLASAKAVLEGTPEPGRPAPEPLFPVAPAPAPVEAPAPAGPAYRGFDTSPWLTAAATAAMAALANRGMADQPRHRQGMDDAVFGDIFGGRGGGGGARGGSRAAPSRPRISLGAGRGGRGMGRRRQG